MNLQDVPLELRQIVEREVAEDEEIRWLGQPDPGRAARQAVPLVLLIAVPFTALVAFWMYHAPGERDWTFLIGLPLLLIGLAMLATPLWRRRKARRTAYVVTDRRAVLIIAGRVTTVTSFGPEELSNITRKERADGSGDLVFRKYGGRIAEPLLTLFKFDPFREAYLGHSGFLGIPRVREIEALLREIGPAAS